MAPIAKGEVRNPKGINQWTYRREAEASLEKWCRSHGAELIEKVCDIALSGRPWAVKLLMERILPVVQEHKIQIPHVDDASIEAALDRFLESGAGEVLAKPHGNGAAAS